MEKFEMKFRDIICLTILFFISNFTTGQNLSRTDSLKYFFRPPTKQYDLNRLYIRSDSPYTYQDDSIFYIYSGIDIFELDSKYKEYPAWTITSDSILEKSHVSHSGYKSVDTVIDLDTVINSVVYPYEYIFRITEENGNTILELNNGQYAYKLVLLHITKILTNRHTIVNGVWKEDPYHIIVMRKVSQ